MKIGEVCERTGLTKRAVRFYIESGLIDPEIVTRNFKEYREYSERDEARLRVISELRRAQFSLEQIKTMLDSPGKIGEVLAEYRSELSVRAGEITRLKDALNSVSAKDTKNAAALARVFSAADTSVPVDMTPHFRRYDDETDADLPEKRDTRYFRPALAFFLTVVMLISMAMSVVRWNARIGAPVIGGEKHSLVSVYDGPVRKVTYKTAEGIAVTAYAASETVEMVDAEELGSNLLTTASSIYCIERQGGGEPNTFYTYDGTCGTDSFAVGRYDIHGFAVGAKITAESTDEKREWFIHDYTSLTDEETVIVETITALRGYTPLWEYIVKAAGASLIVVAAIWIVLRKYVPF